MPTVRTHKSHKTKKNQYGGISHKTAEEFNLSKEDFKRGSKGYENDVNYLMSNICDAGNINIIKDNKYMQNIV